MKIPLSLLVLFASSIHANQEPIVANTKVAIGLAPLHPGIGLWIIRPKTWVGVEFSSLEWEWDRIDHYGGFPVDEGRKSLSFNVRGSFSVQRVFSKGPLYKSGYLAFNHISRQQEGLSRTTGGGGSFEAGFGIFFQPWKKMIVSLRQGVVWEEYEDMEYEAPWWEWGSFMLDENSTRLRLEKPRLWVVVFF